MMMKKINYFLFIGAASIAMACGSGSNNSGDDLTDSLESAVNSVLDPEPESDMAEKTAIATLSGASGSNATGTATFSQLENGKVRFVLEVENLTAGKHAIHLHENGDCSAADATSAGGHWNPTENEHGKRGENGYHAGDIDNMTVGEDGMGNLEMEIEGWSIGDGQDSDILNKAVIIHAEADDFTSQPSGAAGARVACGVIEAGI
ncbi:MAG: superoxide dismutase family protein [Cyclobacteriaceae bacterium]